MAAVPPASPGLDALALRAGDGDAAAESALFRDLRVRFLSIAKRRVHEDSLEDVVQDALRVVHEKYRMRESGAGMLIWSLAVLRNVIGNWYQAKERRGRRRAEVDLQLVPAPPSSSPEAALLDGPGGAGELGVRLEAAIAELAGRHPRCAAIFHHILESLALGGGPREISGRALERMREEEPDLSRGGFYTALHRCRARLRALLDATEEDPGHES